ncbi:hypothetical protein CAPTEDRAFT_194362 [Capitella teleta]|uniref:Uncharacterized protein n=1 Tax=Capitella teleta TaxID=283909 RepID=R7UYJ6_CAPTE|nr:hypothetical protein CAPTEDRAFT_194362 [Capitella teleta]|eukprot:ELU11394.1 hypothetical protein CAPTEDRAFT_194362 [Capitella teleta]
MITCLFSTALKILTGCQEYYLPFDVQTLLMGILKRQDESADQMRNTLNQVDGKNNKNDGTQKLADDDNGWENSIDKNEWNVLTEKRGGFRGMVRVPFPCNGYDNLPRCLNGGKGPKTQWMRRGQLCTCWCPVGWATAECGSPNGGVQD